MKQSSIKKYVAEFIGTMVLVMFGCGTAMLMGPTQKVGSSIDYGMVAGYLATAFAFGLAIVAMAYSIGNISGCHINPAVSLAMLLNGELSLTDFIGYIIAQFAGALTGSALLASIFGMGHVTDMTGVARTKEQIAQMVANGKKLEDITPTKLNGFGANSMAGVNGNHFAGFVVEILLTFVFVLVILGVTSKKAKHGSFGGLVIGLSLVVVHLFGIGLTGTSVNPARSFGPAFCAMCGGNFAPIAALWAFILGPCIGAAGAAICYKFLESKD